MSLGQSERQRKLIVGWIWRTRDNRFDDFQAKMRSDGCQNRHTAQSKPDSLAMARFNGRKRY